MATGWNDPQGLANFHSHCVRVSLNPITGVIAYFPRPRNVVLGTLEM